LSRRSSNRRRCDRRRRDVARHDESTNREIVAALRETRLFRARLADAFEGAAATAAARLATDVLARELRLASCDLDALARRIAAEAPFVRIRVAPADVGTISGAPVVADTSSTPATRSSSSSMVRWTRGWSSLGRGARGVRMIGRRSARSVRCAAPSRKPSYHVRASEDGVAHPARAMSSSAHASPRCMARASS